MQNISSEQELKQLLDDGKITEEEYRELLEAIRQKETVQDPVEVPQKPAKVSNEEAKSKSVHKLGITASVLVLAGFILPALGYFWFYLVVWPNKKPQLVLFLFLFGAIELAGFMMGFISWKDRFGKAATIMSGALLMLSALLLIKLIA